MLRYANGFGGPALTALLAEAAPSNDRALDPMKLRPPHFQPKARSVIFLFMDGGVSHVDSFDPKARLQKESGKPLPFQRPTHVSTVSTPRCGSTREVQLHEP